MKPLSPREMLESNSARIVDTTAFRAGHGEADFVPAFMDFDTQKIYPARFPDGRLATFHVLEGLPDEVVVDRARCGRVVRVKPSVIAGFIRHGYFFTRTAAGRLAQELAAGA